LYQVARRAVPLQSAFHYRPYTRTLYVVPVCGMYMYNMYQVHTTMHVWIQDSQTSDEYSTQNSGICVVRFHGSSFPDRNSPPVKESPGTRSSSYICAGKALKGNVQEVQGSSFIHGDFNCSKNIVPGNSLLLQYFYAMSHKAKKKCTGTV
jgi:hypothetical protein